MDTIPSPTASDSGLRAQISSLLGLFALSITMFDSDDENRILDFALTAVPSLGPFRAEVGYLWVGGRPVFTPIGPRAGDADVLDQTAALQGEDGPVLLADRPWARAYGLRSLGGWYGYIIASADVADPPADATFLLGILSQQAGAALASASLHHRERDQAGALQHLNDQLTASVAGLANRARIHETLTRASSSGDGDEGIARVVHELTDLPVIVEDRFGNLRTYAGPVVDGIGTMTDARHHRELLARAARAGAPVRDGNRLVALARAQGDVLGTIALVDPDSAARPEQVAALELGAMALAVSLAHIRSLAEMQVRLRRDLVEDLLSGTDEGSAIARAEAQGHDLQRPHSVLALQWKSVSTEALFRAVERAATELEMGALVARRPGLVLLVAAHPDWWRRDEGWSFLFRVLERELGSGAGAIGVGSTTTPSAVPRSLEEALQALTIRAGSRAPHGVTMFGELGIDRILAAGEVRGDVDSFVREWLGALIDYDATHHSELVRTLASYCESGGNYDQTALALHIHRSTLRYRLQRIREIGGRDINDVETRFNLHAATRAWRVIDAPP
jgi:sugar diacid utilization regulator